ncbi:MAG: hypothetical protein ABI203_10445, partial [Mucilaginibacter sp.]
MKSIIVITCVLFLFVLSSEAQIIIPTATSTTTKRTAKKTYHSRNAGNVLDKTNSSVNKANGNVNKASATADSAVSTIGKLKKFGQKLI